MVECLDGLARITSKKLATIHFCENGTLQNVCSTRQRVVVCLGKRCSFAHRQVDEQPTKRSKKNDDKSAVAYIENRKLARKRICHRWMSRSNGETYEKK